MNARWLIAGFIAGALAFLIFHQGAIGLLHQMGVVPRPPYSMQPTPPWGVPQLWSLAFWSGVWGIALAATLQRWDGAKFVVAALIFGVVFPTLVAWFVVAPLRGQPVAAGWVPARMWIGPFVNGMWGLGTGILLVLARIGYFRRPVIRP
jgi:hypothetical protein